ncbi:MAG: helix-turn-helix transcriptional regulator [Thiomicrospira sp.]|uniref:helix-turn-helix domain-containing protein n=1 Tax=Thiomicrospira sp. TaxID=935 RepID=UPI0019E0265C|nr:helix-turn-helix transcriptional regulator [Thiomicrospira sp.]MBE0493642.1 helix-turn-helix transcriptional regulator [Thiomicrospira sp.]
MNALTNYQVIELGGQPAFVVVPYEEFMSRYAEPADEGLIPHVIVERNAVEGVPMIKAWREYLGLTQSELAEKCGMAQSAIARLEAQAVSPRKDTLYKLAKAMNLTLDQLAE